ncbi:MAG TPA: ubiquitin-like protein Pup [Euzebya sp.]|nr:ubiquitin-like protein Pup [Euzebya sp.]
MSDGGQVRKHKGKQSDEQAAEVESKTTEVDTSDIDDLLDEIDEVLEETAEEFVKNYVQKGGQ